jgi:hypothetical protein
MTKRIILRENALTTKAAYLTSGTGTGTGTEELIERPPVSSPIPCSAP